MDVEKRFVPNVSSLLLEQCSQTCNIFSLGALLEVAVASMSNLEEVSMINLNTHTNPQNSHKISPLWLIQYNWVIGICGSPMFYTFTCQWDEPWNNILVFIINVQVCICSLDLLNGSEHRGHLYNDHQFRSNMESNCREEILDISYFSQKGIKYKNLHYHVLLIFLYLHIENFNISIMSRIPCRIWSMLLTGYLVWWSLWPKAGMQICDMKMAQF